jgi:hypothetical protein
VNDFTEQFPVVQPIAQTPQNGLFKQEIQILLPVCIHQMMEKRLETLAVPVEPVQSMMKGFVIILALFLRRKIRNPLSENMNRDYKMEKVLFWRH